MRKIVDMTTSFESTTSKLLVYDPQDAFFTLNDYHNNFLEQNENDLTVYLGRNWLTGQRKHGDYLVAVKDFFEYYFDEDNGYHFVRNKELNIEYTIESFEEIIDSLLDELVFLWNTYVDVAESSLTKDAVKLKKRIIKHYSVLKG